MRSLWRPGSAWATDTNGNATKDSSRTKRQRVTRSGFIVALLFVRHESDATACKRSVGLRQLGCAAEEPLSIGVESRSAPSVSHDIALRDACDSCPWHLTIST